MYFIDGKFVIDDHGRVHTVPLEIKDMFYPVRHISCGNVHDAGKVEIEARYLDCSVWRCPGCKVLIDDRPWTHQIEDLRDLKRGLVR